MVTAYQPVPLAVIQQLDPIYVDVTQSSADLLRLRRGLASGALKSSGTLQNRVKLLLEDGTPYPREGKLQFRDVTVDPTTGSVVLRLVFPNPDSVLLPGMFVRAIVEEGVDEQGILAPQQGVTRDRKGNGRRPGRRRRRQGGPAGAGAGPRHRRPLAGDQGARRRGPGDRRGPPEDPPGRPRQGRPVRPQGGPPRAPPPRPGPRRPKK